MNEKKENKRAPIHISRSDVERAFKKVEEFQKLIEKGKTPQEIFRDLVRLISVDK
jgi:CRISPR/Cas system-associated exonuclease Cas4 (RecB family)